MESNLKPNFVPKTQEEAIEAVLARLEALHIAIFNASNKSQPLSSLSRIDEPSWVTMCRWMPTLCDYENFACRANQTLARTIDNLDRREAFLNERELRLRKKEDEVSKLLGRLLPFKSSLKELLEALNV